MLDETISAIPAQPGAYALWLHLPQPEILTVGKLGSFTFPAGDYVYLGSARGPGGLRARLGRHLRGDCSQRSGKPHWHIDHLRAAAQVRGFGYEINTMNLIPKECTWSQKLAALPAASIPVPGFGASDCRSGCAAHLVQIPILDKNQIANLLNFKIHCVGDE